MGCNRDNMTALVTALESGEYAQAQYELRSPDGFCCLGVATDLAVKAGIGEWVNEVGDWFYRSPSGGTNAGTMEPEVQRWLGVNSDYHLDLGLEATGDPRYGSDMNDNGKSFTEIAAAIRETYLA